MSPVQRWRGGYLVRALLTPPTDLVEDGPHAQYDIDETGYQLSRTYEKLQEGDPSLLERLAVQEALEERQRHRRSGRK